MIGYDNLKEFLKKKISDEATDHALTMQTCSKKKQSGKLLNLKSNHGLREVINICININNKKLNRIS